MPAVWNDHQPIWWQVRDQLVARILEGTLRDGQAPPSVRQCAAELHLNPLTVARAYQDLVDAGVLEKRRGLGTVVAEGGQARLRAQERSRFLEEEWPQIRAKMKRLGVEAGKLG